MVAQYDPILKMNKKSQFLKSEKEMEDITGSFRRCLAKETETSPRQYKMKQEK